MVKDDFSSFLQPSRLAMNGHALNTVNLPQLRNYVAGAATTMLATFASVPELSNSAHASMEAWSAANAPVAHAEPAPAATLALNTAAPVNAGPSRNGKPAFTWTTGPKGPGLG